MRFSVIIPLYNKAPYVAKAIESVLSQTFADYELIIVDDGSKDDSAAIAAHVIEGHANCRLVCQENAGVSMARNKGVAVSKGDYLCFLDADDWWDFHFLEEMSKLIDEFPDAGIFGTSYIIVNETKHKTRVSPIGVEAGFEKGYINYCQVYAKTLAMPLTSITVAIPRLVFEEMKGFPKGIKLGEDFLLWIHIAQKYKVAFLNKPLAHYNQDVDAVNRGVGKLYEPQEHMLWNLKDLEPQEGLNKDYKNLVDALRVSGMMEYYISPKFGDAAKKELDKVDWKLQRLKELKQYRKPIIWLRCENRLKILGSRLKQYLRCCALLRKLEV